MTDPKIDLGADRRGKPRSPQDNAATNIVQALIRDPRAAVAAIESDLDAGGNPRVVLALLDAVEAILAIRGVDRDKQLAALRKTIETRMGNPPTG